MIASELTSEEELLWHFWFQIDKSMDGKVDAKELRAVRALNYFAKTFF